MIFSRRIKKAAVFFSATILIGALVFPIAASANVPVGSGPDQVQSSLNIGVTNYKSVSDLSTLLGAVIKWVYTIFFVVAVLFILVAAYNFIRGGTNPKAIETAKAQLKYAVIAIVIALLATAVSVIIEAFLKNGS